MRQLGFSLLGRLRRRMQRMLGACTMGVRAIVVNDDHKLLFVKHTYAPGWYLPGGGVDPGETPAQAIKRELYEEAGVVVQQTPTLRHIFYHQVRAADDYVALYFVDKFSLEITESSEIEAIDWFAVDELPHDVTCATRRRIDEYKNSKPFAARW